MTEKILKNPDYCIRGRSTNKKVFPFRFSIVYFIITTAMAHAKEKSEAIPSE